MAVADHPPFDLIEAKLAPPPLRSGVVVKTDVIAPLCASPLPFASVIAPAGYGKTTLLALWAETDPRPFAWVALDGRDDDAVLFLQYIAAALNRVEPLAPEVFDALSGPGGSSWSTHVPRLGSALASLERPLVLVLDDLHAIANPACLDVLAALCEHVPAGSLIATASREEPSLPLARWRTQGRLHEIGVTDLRLDQQEAAALLSGAGVELDPTDVADLTERTEGWPAGLYLAALSLQAGAPDPAPAWCSPATTGWCRSTSASRSCPGCRRPRPGSSRTRRCSRGCAAASATRCSRPRGPRRRSSRSCARTASSCRSIGEASGTATTTCSASSCGASSSGASPRRWPRSTPARWPGAWPMTCRRRRSSTDGPRARRRPSQSWSPGSP